MLQFLTSSTANFVISLAVTGVLVVVGIYIIAKVRGEMRNNRPNVSEMITNFQQLRESGELSDAEYRTIKGMLAEKMQRELNDSGETR